MLFKYPNNSTEVRNMDYILKELQRIINEWSEWNPAHEIKFADPIEWNSNTFYPEYTIVLDPNTGDSYLSKVDVRAGIPLSNTNYWLKIANFNAQYENLVESAEIFNMKYEGADTTGATPADDILDLAIASGKNIYFPKGTYLFNRQHEFQDIDVVANKAVIHTSSFGNNQGVVNSYGGFNSTYEQMVFRLKQNVNLEGFIFDRLDSGGVVIQGDNCTMKNCRISTFATIAGSTGYYGIVIRNCANIHISDITIQMDEGNNRDGIHIESNSHNIYIDNCEIFAGDDGLAFNALEGTGGNIHNVFVNNCYIGGYGVRFFGCGETSVHHIEINNCTIEVTSNRQSGCIRFSNSIDVIGGTTIGTDGFFDYINITNCNLIGNASTNLSIYTYHAYVACRLTNCVLYNVVYYDESTKGTYINFSNCWLNAAIDVKANATYTSIEICECDIKSLIKSGNGTLLANLTDTNISTELSISGESADYVKIDNSFINPAGVILRTVGGTFSISNTRVQPLFNFEAGTNANYFINNLVGHGGGNIITSASNAARIVCDGLVDGLPSAPVNTDHVFIGNLLKYYLRGEWLTVSMVVYNG